MKVRVAVIIIVIFLLIAAGGLTLYAWKSRPQIIKLSPQAETDNVSATSPIRIQFSCPMETNSIEVRLQIEPSMSGTQTWDGNTLVFIPNQPWPSGRMINVQIEAGGRALSWLAFPMGRLSWSFSIREAALAYLWPSAGPASIYALDPATGSISQYTHGINVLDYSASMDGGWLYFSASNAQSGADLYQIDRFMLDGQPGAPYQAEKLLDCGSAQCRNPVVSADGKNLAYEYLQSTPPNGSSQVQVWTLRLSDKETALAGQSGHETGQPAWSSFGLLAYYDWTSSNYEVLNPVTEDRLELLNQTGQPGAWSPNGEAYLAPEISYKQATQSYETGISHLLRYDIQLKNSLDLTGEGAVEDVEAAYSPDGGLIAFTRKFLDPQRWSPGRQIWLMGSDGSNPHALSNELNYNHYDLAWSRDGSTLAYVRFNQENISDPVELWMVNVDGSNPVQLVIGGYSPIWIP